MVLMLAQKIAKAQNVLEEALHRFGNKIAVAWTGGKDSTTTLHLIRSLCGGRVPIPVLNIDTGAKFKEIYEFRDQLAREWQLNLIIERNEEAMQTIEIAKNKEECCLLLKARVIANSLEKYGWEALITGMRWDEQPERVQEEYFSPRENPPHVRVHPILPFNEGDIWNYIQDHQIPYCVLYRRGYRSLGCEPCTNLGLPAGAERAGRAQGKEEIMGRLRSLGYF